MGWVDSWIAAHPGKVSATYPTDNLVEQMLQHVEVLPRLGLERRKEIDHHDVTRWNYFTGANVDPTPIEPFMEKMQELLGVEKQLELGGCVSEAMTNVRHHAYEDGIGGKWWIFATISDSNVFLAMYDRGKSIPLSLLEKPVIWDYLSGRMWGLGRGDGQLIAAASGGRTSTKLAYRGKGLPEMLEFTKRWKGSELGIFSRGGFFRYTSLETSGRLKTPIPGTLIIWTLNLLGDKK